MKTKDEFVELLAQLQKGTIQEFLVEHDEFFSFREAWLTLDNRNEIIGEASLNGQITYRLKS